MMKAVWQAARSADAVIGIIDVSANPKDALETIEQIFQSKEAKALPFAIVRPFVQVHTPFDHTL